MEWAQVLAIIIPIMFSIVVGIFYQNRRFDDVNRRFDDVNRRIDDVNKRVDDLRSEIKEIKADLREIKTLIVILIQKEAGVKVKEGTID